LVGALLIDEILRRREQVSFLYLSFTSGMLKRPSGGVYRLAINVS